MLPLDILVYLLTHFDSRRELLRYASTCHFLYNASLPHLLAYRNVITDPHKLSSFCDFILKDFPRRCEMLIDLHLDISYRLESCTPNTARKLLEVLSSTKNLYQFTMSDQRKFREKLGLGEKGFGELIAGFSKLRILEIGAAEEINTLHYLRITKAPLLTLKIAFEWRTVEYEERPHFSTSLLESFAQTLRRLSLKWIYIDFSNIVCRSVHTLTLKNAQQNFSLQSLISSFPSVHTLYVDTSDGISFLFNDKTLKRSYKRNRSVDSTSTWPCLHILAGHLDSLFALGLSSPTFHLRLHGINIVNGARIATLLSDIQPQHLDITFVPHHHEYSITAAQLETVIPSHVASNIKVAIFRILLDSSDGDPMLAVYALTKTLKSPCVILHLSTYKKPDFTVDIDLIAMKVLVENLDIRYLAITALVRHNYYNTYGGKLWRVSPQSTLEVLPRELIVELEDPGSALDTIEKLNSSV